MSAILCKLDSRVHGAEVSPRAAWEWMHIYVFVRRACVREACSILAPNPCRLHRSSVHQLQSMCLVKCLYNNNESISRTSPDKFHVQRQRARIHHELNTLPPVLCLNGATARPASLHAGNRRRTPPLGDAGNRADQCEGAYVIHRCRPLPTTHAPSGNPALDEPTRARCKAAAAIRHGKLLIKGSPVRQDAAALHRGKALAAPLLLPDGAPNILNNAAVEWLHWPVVLTLERLERIHVLALD
jgi:hypothetical protein